MASVPNTSAWHAEAQRLKSEIKSALDAYPSPSPVRPKAPSIAAVTHTPDDNIARLQQQVNQVHDFVHDTGRKDLLIQDLRAQVAQLLKERQQAEQSHEGVDAQLELARRQEEGQAKTIASLRRKLEDTERHQQRDMQDALSARQLLEKRVTNLDAERRQLQTERDSLLAETAKYRQDAELAGDAAAGREAAITEAVGAQVELRKLRKELDETKRALSDVQEKAAQLEQKEAVSDMRTAALTAERDGLRKELSSVRDDLSAASHEASERNQAKQASVEHQRAAEAAQKEILQLQSRLAGAEDEKASAQRKLETRRKEFDEEHARYEAKAKEAAEALQQVASLSAAESEASRLRVRAKECEKELADTRKAAAATSEALSALGLRFETSEAALHSAARVIQAALDDTLASVESRHAAGSSDITDDSELLPGSDGEDNSASSSHIDQSMNARRELLKQAGTDAGVLANVCNSVGEICREMRRSERRTTRAESAMRAMRTSLRAQKQDQDARTVELQSAEQRIATASATAAAQAAALQKVGRELEEERAKTAAVEQEMKRRHQQFGRVHEQLCGLRRPHEGESVPDGRLSWAGLVEDAGMRIQAVAEALRLEESRHEMAVEAAGHAEASLARARLEVEEGTERSAAAMRRSADAQAAAAAAHNEELNKAVNAERKRAEEQIAELVASYGGKIRMVEAEFSRSAARVEAAEKSAMAKAQVRKRSCKAIYVLKMLSLPRQARDKHRENSKGRPFSQLVEESHRQVAEAERRTSVLKAEAERCNEHAADMERRAATAAKMQRDAESKVARAESERGSASRRCMQLEGELSRAQAQIDRLGKDRDEASANLAALDQRVAEVSSAAARMQEDALTAQAQVQRDAADAVQAAENRVRTELQAVIKDKEANITELRRSVVELRKQGAAAERDHEKVATEVEQELLALAAQHREVVAALEERVRRAV
jgi:chromosome segregation ATPase